MRKKNCAMAFALTVFALILVGNTQEASAIEFGGKSIGEVESLNLSEIEGEKGRVALSADIRLDGLLSTIDSALGSQGDLRSGCSQRLYWRGQSRVQGASSELSVKSAIRYEQWLCVDLLFDDLRTRLVSISTDVDWKLFVPPNELDELKIVAAVTDLDDIPDELEEWFGVRVRQDIKIPLPEVCGQCSCVDLFSSLQAELDSVLFSAEKNGVIRAHIRISMSGDLSELAKCID